MDVPDQLLLLRRRALVLPPTLCSCELGFWPKHIGGRCVAGDHKMLALPYVCPIDHYLDPSALANSPFAHRERPFLDNNRTAPALLASRVGTTRYRTHHARAEEVPRHQLSLRRALWRFHPAAATRRM